MTSNLTAKDIVKLMDENNITLHDLASEQNKILYVYSIEDIICRINDSNEKYGVEMSDEEKLKIANEVFDRFSFGNYQDFYDTTDFAIDELIEKVKEEFEQEDKGEEECPID